MVAPLTDMRQFYANAGDWSGASRETGNQNAAVQGQALSTSNAAAQKALQDQIDAQAKQTAFRDTQRQKIQDLTEGRATAVANDPRLNSAQDFFGSVMSGQNVPFSQEVQRAQLNQQANGTAAANAAQLQALQEAVVANGGSLSDPSYQAKKQELMSNRQGQNLNALGQMLSHAQVDNFNAQSGAANNLVAARTSQNAQVNALGLAGAGYRAQDFLDTQTGPTPGTSAGSSWTQGPTLGGGGTFTPFQGQYSGGSSAARPAAPAASAQAPRPASPSPVFSGPNFYSSTAPYASPGGSPLAIHVGGANPGPYSNDPNATNRLIGPAAPVPGGGFGGGTPMYRPFPG